MPKGVKKKKFRPCKICLSEYRYQIEHAVNANVPREEILDQYMTKAGYSKRTTFSTAINRHMAPKHYKEALKVPFLAAPKGSEHKFTKTSLNALAQSMMDVGGEIVQFWKENPLIARKEMKISDISKMQDSLTKRMQVETQQNALKLMMGKMFGGFIPEEIEEGEIVEEPAVPLLTEN